MDTSNRCRRAVRLPIICMTAAMAFVSLPARPQNFLADFYNQSGPGQANVSSAGVYQSAGLNTVTGGGFVFKVPRRQFTPFYITPPSLKAGCGGIDIFAGAFSLPSGAEFVGFLRNIGQNLQGLAFELALQSMSPDLAQQVKSFRNLILEKTEWLTDSCKAASALLEAGKELMYGQQHRVKNEMRARGECTDEADCTVKVQANFGEVMTACRRTPVQNSGGNLEEACEMNLTWALLKSGQLADAAPDSLRELLMSVLGSRIVTLADPNPAQPTAADQVLRSRSLPPIITEPDELVGTVTGQTNPLTFTYYRCDEPVACLNPWEDFVVPNDRRNSFAAWVYDIASRYYRAVVNRIPYRAVVNRIPEGSAGGVTREEMQALASASSIPIIRIINAVAYNRYAGLAEDVIRIFSEAVAYEMAMRFMDSLLADAEKLVQTKTVNAQLKAVQEDAKEIGRMIRVSRTKLMARSKDLNERMVRLGSYVTYVEHLERSLRTSMAADLAANLRFGR